MSVVQPHILRLPDELLDKILGLLSETRPDVLPNKRGYENAETLVLVCRRFKQLVTPYLYSCLYIRCPAETERWFPSVEEDLHRTLSENRSLRTLCRSLVIEHGTRRRYVKPSKGLYIAMDLVTWLTAIKSLDVSTYGDLLTWREAWSIVSHAIKFMDGLRELRFRDSRIYCDLSLPMVIEDFDKIGPNLRLLELHGISELSDSDAWRKLNGLAGTGSITELRLFGFLQPPQVLAGLVAWPAKLEKFSFRFCFQPNYQYSELMLNKDWNLDTMRRILDMHRATLRSVEISHLNTGGIDKFDLSNFTSLEHLSLSHGCTGNDVNHIANLYTPNLRSFHWDMSLEDPRGGETLDSFGQEQEDWLRAFVYVYIKSKSNLRNITITFTPELWARSIDSNDRLIYPWDRMDALAEEIRAYGIELSYNPPTTSREQFLEWYGDKPPDQWPSPLWLALETRNDGVLERLLIDLLNGGGDIDSRRDGRTLLHAAAENGFTVPASWLLSGGASVNARCEQSGETSLLIAAKQNNVAIVQLLLENGADIELGDGDGRTPLIAAAIWGAHETLQLLLDSGARFDAKDELWGKTPLIWAIENNHLGVVVRLLDKGADRGMPDGHYGQTPLEWAIKLSHDDIVEVLNSSFGNFPPC